MIISIHGVMLTVVVGLLDVVLQTDDIVQRIFKDTYSKVLLLSFQYVLQLQLVLGYEHQIVDVDDPGHSLFLDIPSSYGLVYFGVLVEHVAIASVLFDLLDLAHQLLLILFITSLISIQCCCSTYSLFILFVSHMVINAVDAFQPDGLQIL